MGSPESQRGAEWETEMEEPDDQLYADDLVIGARFAGREYRLDADGFRAFAALTGDAHPIHYDEAYAARTDFGRPVAHGLYLMALTALGATPLSRRLEAAMVAMIDQGCRFVRPGFAGDCLRSEFEVSAVETRPGRDTAVVRFAVRLIDCASNPVLEGHQTYLLRPRAAARDGGGA
jgi:3-hydroxybutyryl-CoA dehydratase